ncbi:MAG TPA: DUF3565 domain-containing protein [Candidatus Methylomirabilis sp.]|nr:DUF3565 domain-containing protein [Candidatus Methylomirabilis sp.]
MQRRIAGFHEDEHGDWVADLQCGHGQHMRHSPPWTNPRGERRPKAARATWDNGCAASGSTRSNNSNRWCAMRCIARLQKAWTPAFAGVTTS